MRWENTKSILRLAEPRSLSISSAMTKNKNQSKKIVGFCLIRPGGVK